MHSNFLQQKKIYLRPQWQQKWEHGSIFQVVLLSQLAQFALSKGYAAEGTAHCCSTSILTLHSCSSAGAFSTNHSSRFNPRDCRADQWELAIGSRASRPNTAVQSCSPHWTWPLPSPAAWCGEILKQTNKYQLEEQVVYHSQFCITWSSVNVIEVLQYRTSHDSWLVAATNLHRFRLGRAAETQDGRGWIWGLVTLLLKRTLRLDYWPG